MVSKWHLTWLSQKCCANWKTQIRGLCSDKPFFSFSPSRPLVKITKTKMFPSMARLVPHIEEKILSYMRPRDLTVSMSVCMEWWYVIVKRKAGKGPLIEAAGMGLERVIAFLLSEKSVNVNEVLSRYPRCCPIRCLNEFFCTEAKAKGFTALMFAARDGHDGIVEQLLERRDTDVNASNEYSRTALILAAQRGHERVVRLLLDRNDIDVNVVAYRRENTSCIMCEGHICYPKFAKVRGHTALMFAAKIGHKGTVEQLLKRTDIDVNATNKKGQTALMLAALKGHGRIVGLLKDRNGVNIYAEDKWCNTASELASNYQIRWHNSTEDELIMKLLLCGEDDFVNAIVDGRNTLMEAVIRGFDRVAELLLERGAINVNAVDRSGQTALILAAQRGHDAIVELLLARKETDVNAADQYGTFPLLMAARGGHEKVVR